MQFLSYLATSLLLWISRIARFKDTRDSCMLRMSFAGTRARTVSGDEGSRSVKEGHASCRKERI